MSMLALDRFFPCADELGRPLADPDELMLLLLLRSSVPECWNESSSRKNRNVTSAD